jgi:hypothetical protein
MKKTIYRLTAITIALLSFTAAARFGSVSAADGVTLTVMPSTQTAKTGDEVTFTIGMSGAEGTNFFAFGFDILIPDGLILKPGTGAVTAAFKEATGFADADFQETPRLNISGGLNDAVYNGGPLNIATFVCTALGSGDKTVTLKNVELLDESVAYIPVNLVPAKISVAGVENTAGGSIPPAEAGATETGAAAGGGEAGTAPERGTSTQTPTGPAEDLPDDRPAADKPNTEAPAWSNPFADVSASDWFYGNVEYVAKNRLMNGTATDTFSPNAAMTRAMLVTVLHRLENEPVAAHASSFSDVSADKYYAAAVAWASENSIVTGTGNGRFAPDADITREQLAAILYRCAGARGLDVSTRGDASSFTDAGDVSSWAGDALSWAVGAGIITGRSNPTGTELAPKGKATRAEVAAVLMRFIERTAEI